MSADLDARRFSTADVAALSLADLEAIVAQYGRLVAARDADPELAATIARRVDEALACGRIDDEQAASIRDELERVHPGVVLAGHAEEILDLDRPALGAFPRRQTPAKAPDIAAWYREDPRRLVAYVLEVDRFACDELRSLQAGADFAEELGIADEIAEPVLEEACRQMRARRREEGARRGC